MAGRAYKTLPTAFRKDDSPRRSRRGQSHPTSNHGPQSPSGSSSSSRTQSSSSSSEGRLFGLNLHLGISNLISGGMNFLGQLRKKTPLSVNSSSTSPTLSPHRGLLSSDVSSISAGSSAATNASYCDSSRTQVSATEMIEMTSFAAVPLAEGEHEEQSGLGHEFAPVTTFNPTWCDLCRDLIWGLYDTGGMRCSHCDLTCHEKCRQDVRLNCTTFERGLLRDGSTSSSSSSSTDVRTDDSTLANISTLRDEEEFLNEEDEVKTLKNPNLEEFSPDEMVDVVSSINDHSTLSESPPNFLSSIPQDLIDKAIEEHNRDFPTSQETVITDSGNVHGFIRVQLNLRRPINVLPGTRPPSVYTISKKCHLSDNATEDGRSGTTTTKERTLTSFYLPSDTFKVLHVESDTTTDDVIRNLLKKFRVVDNPHKFALYVKNCQSTKTSLESVRRDSIDSVQKNTLARVRMRRLNGSEKPLLLALSWKISSLTESGNSIGKNILVLQENDPGEIVWESFSLPELKNFLRILDREEAWYKKRIHEKYEFLGTYMQQLADKKKEELLAQQ